MMRAGASEDDALLARARRGDEAAFEELVLRHTPRLFRLVGRMAGDDLEAEAVLQEAWLRAWQAMPRHQAGRPFFPWLARIALNVARDRWRKRAPLDFSDLGPRVEEVPDAEGLGPEPELERREALDRLARGVAELRPAYRAVIALRYEAEMSYAEMAEALGLPVNTVRTHLRRAKIELRRRLEERDAGLDG